MVRKDIPYVDFNGVSQKEVAWFNLNKAELGRLHVKNNGTYLDNLQTLAEKRRVEEMYDFIYNLILDAYGERDPSGRKFIKTKEMRDDFEQSIAFSEFLLEMINNGDKLADFIQAVIPADLSVVKKAVDVGVEALPAAN